MSRDTRIDYCNPDSCWVDHGTHQPMLPAEPILPAALWAMRVVEEEGAEEVETAPICNAQMDHMSCDLPPEHHGWHKSTPHSAAWTATEDGQQEQARPTGHCTATAYALLGDTLESARATRLSCHLRAGHPGDHLDRMRSLRFRRGTDN